MVEIKSEGVIKIINKDTIEELAGISINDLLPLLSISKDAYEVLRNGGDAKAIKSASIIQRKLQGMDEEFIKYCSNCKIKWDVWLRESRHSLSELDINSILNKVRTKLYNLNKQGFIDFDFLDNLVNSILDSLEDRSWKHELNEDLILGCVFCEIIRLE